MSWFRRRRDVDRSSAPDEPTNETAPGLPDATEPPPPPEPAGGPQPDTGGAAEPPADAAASVGDPDDGTGRPGSEPPRRLFGRTRDALAPVRKRHVVIASMGLMGFAAAGVLVFSAASFWWTSQPSFCNRCHVMNKYVDSWSASPHRDVNCENCHLTPGLFGFLGGKIAGLQVVMNYIRGEYEDYSFSAAVSNASCLQCHESILQGNIHDPASGIVVSHSDIIETGGKCVSCHSTVAHGDAVPVGSATHPTMQTCLRCHNDDIAPLRCSLCHVGREPPSATPPVSTAFGQGG